LPEVSWRCTVGSVRIALSSRHTRVVQVCPDQKLSCVSQIGGIVRKKAGRFVHPAL
jgi:hypothetical protein